MNEDENLNILEEHMDDVINKYKNRKFIDY